VRAAGESMVAATRTLRTPRPAAEPRRPVARPLPDRLIPPEPPGELVIRATHVEAPPLPFDGEPDLADPAAGPDPTNPDPDPEAVLPAGNASRAPSSPGRTPPARRRRRPA